MLGNLGYCNSDILEAERVLTKHANDYCQIVGARPRLTGLPAHIEPPPNSIRWPLRGSLAMPAVPDGTDLLVPMESDSRVPLGYDGILIAITNMWNGTGFVDASGDITWRVKQDRRYIPFFDSITVTQGSLAIPLDVVGQGILLYSGQLLKFFVNFAVGAGARLNAGGKVICALTGYIWPRGDRVQ